MGGKGPRRRCSEHIRCRQSLPALEGYFKALRRPLYGAANLVWVQGERDDGVDLRVLGFGFRTCLVWEQRERDDG